ncbi:MAG: radical SAM protein, partial [Treponema sp.]|nr:radical SAM protein [Treponema sp.]
MNGGESTNSQLTDAYGRTIDYLRVSITDRCNLRCLYCMPPEGIQWIPHDDVLRFEEILRICRILAGLGIRAVRITGGEPLVRRGVPDLVRELKAIRGIERVSMTSNGVLLGENLEALAVAGLDAVNISLDTLNGERYRLITLRDDPGNILSAVNRALELGLEVKINCVPLAGINEADIVPLAGQAKDKNIPVRFIELMPLGA